jgi:hypothetical protein
MTHTTRDLRIQIAGGLLGLGLLSQPVLAAPTTQEPAKASQDANRQSEPASTPSAITTPAADSTAPRIVRGTAPAYQPGVSRSFPVTAGFSYQAGSALPVVPGLVPYYGSFGTTPIINGPYQPYGLYDYATGYPSYGYGFGGGLGYGYSGYGYDYPASPFGFVPSTPTIPNPGMPYYGMPRVYVPARGGYYRR